MYKKTIRVCGYLTVLVLTFTGSANVSAGSGGGMDVLAMGGGPLDGVTLQSGVIEDVSFTFFAAYDKDGNPEGSFHFKRGYSDGGISAVLSTEITSIETYFDSENNCPLVMMTGIAKLIPTWAHKPVAGQKFTLKAWDCDRSSGAIDMVWFEVRRVNDTVRPGLSLLEPVLSLKGNILIQ